MRGAVINCLVKFRVRGCLRRRLPLELSKGLPHLIVGHRLQIKPGLIRQVVHIVDQFALVQFFLSVRVRLRVNRLTAQLIINRFKKIVDAGPLTMVRKIPRFPSFQRGIIKFAALRVYELAPADFFLVPVARAHVSQIAAGIDQAAGKLARVNILRLRQRARVWLFRQVFQQTRAVNFAVAWSRAPGADRVNRGVKIVIPPRPRHVGRLTLDLNILRLVNRLGGKPHEPAHRAKKRHKQRRVGFGLILRLSGRLQLADDIGPHRLARPFRRADNIAHLKRVGVFTHLAGAALAARDGRLAALHEIVEILRLNRNFLAGLIAHRQQRVFGMIGIFGDVHHLEGMTLGWPFATIGGQGLQIEPLEHIGVVFQELLRLFRAHPVRRDFDMRTQPVIRIGARKPCGKRRPGDFHHTAGQLRPFKLILHIRHDLRKRIVLCPRRGTNFLIIRRQRVSVHIDRIAGMSLHQRFKGSRRAHPGFALRRGVHHAAP